MIERFKIKAIFKVKRALNSRMSHLITEKSLMSLICGTNEGNLRLE